MERWQHIWRDGLAPQFSKRGLEALQAALLSDDSRLVQGRTMTPPPLVGLDDAEVEATCALGFCAWQGDGCDTVGELAAFFQELCAAADAALGEPAACRHFLDWYDLTPRSAMRRQLLKEVRLALNAPQLVAA